VPNRPRFRVNPPKGAWIPAKPGLVAAWDRHTIGGMEHAGAAIPEERAAAAEEAAGARASLRYGNVLQGVSALVAPATLLTGIAFYFGWARVDAFDEYFGLDPSAVGYSTRDYVLNSLNALFLPVVVVLTALLALALVHAYVTDAHRTGRRSPKTLHRLSEVALTVGAALLVVGAFGVFDVFTFQMPYLISTLFPAAGVLLIAHAVDLRERLRGDPPLSTAGRVLVGLFVAVCLFWATGLYARTVGRNEAASVARHLDELPGVAIASTSDLDLPTGGPRTPSPAGGGTTYVYGRLRLLALANGTMFLLPSKWTPSHGGLFAVPQVPSMRVAFTPGKAPPSGSLLRDAFNGNDVPATGGGLDGGGRPPVLKRRLGPLLVRLAVGENGAASVTLVNGTSRAVSGISLVTTLKKHAQPLLVGTAALCRAQPSRLECTVDAIPPQHRLKLRISYRGPREVGGQLVARLGRVRRVLPLALSR
jgi:hypothetical protein